MHKGIACRDTTFPGGIVNGAAWYSFDGTLKIFLEISPTKIPIILGGMSDYNYAFHGCYELTLEISCCKFPPASELPRLWNENREALLEFVKEAHRGVTGVVLDEDTGSPVAGASLKIIGRDIEFATSHKGEFWRLLLPGNYTLEVKAEGYHPALIDFEVKSYTALPKLTSQKVLLVNVTKPAPTTTTLANTTKQTTIRTTRRTEGLIERKTTTEAKPVFFKQISTRNADASGAAVWYTSQILSTLIAVMLLR